MQSQSKNAVVVGAGPSGCLAACYLAQRGWQVKVVERRGVEACTASSTHRAYPMGLNIRSTKAVNTAGIVVPSLSDQAQTMEYVVFNGTASSISWPGATNTYLVDRIALNRELYEAARAYEYHGGGSITWNFGYTLGSVDFNNKEAVFIGADAASGSPAASDLPDLHLQYDLLVGADGGRSAVRAALQQVVPSLTTHLLFQPTQTYKTFHGLEAEPGRSLHPSLATGQPGQHLYFNMYQGKSSGTFFKQPDGTVSGLMLSHFTFGKQAVRGMLVAAHKGIPAAWVDSISNQVDEEGPQQPSGVGALMKVSQFHGPSTVLLGDAAHPVTPAMGQGCNLALEDVRLFMELLDRLGPEQAPAAFTRQRIADIHAFQDLELAAVSLGSGRTTASLPRKMSALWLMGAGGIPYLLLHKLAKSRFPARTFLTSVLRDDSWHWKTVLRVQQAQAVGVTLLLGAGVAAALASVAKAVSSRM